MDRSKVNCQEMMQGDAPWWFGFARSETDLRRNSGGGVTVRPLLGPCHGLWERLNGGSAPCEKLPRA